MTKSLFKKAKSLKALTQPILYSRILRPPTFLRCEDFFGL